MSQNNTHSTAKPEIAAEDRAAYLVWIAATGGADAHEATEIERLRQTDTSFDAMVERERAWATQMADVTSLNLAASLGELAARTAGRQAVLRWMWRGAVVAAGVMAACVAVVVLLRTQTETGQRANGTSGSAVAGVFVSLPSVPGGVGDGAAGSPAGKAVLELAISPPEQASVAARELRPERTGSLALVIPTGTAAAQQSLDVD